MNLNKNGAIHILHANTNALMHHGIERIVESGGGIKGVKQARNEQELFEALAGSEFDVVVIDPKRDHGFDISSLMKIQKEFPEQNVLIISDVKNESMVLSVLEKGVQGYLTYECDRDEIIHAIFAISKGEKFYCNKVLDIVFNKHLYKKEAENCEPTSLTVRETEVARFLAKGLTNRQVAEKIHLSPHTVHTHRKNIMKKLGVKSASELTIYALSIGLIEA